MFHLLVANEEWPDSGGSLLNSRIYIHPDDELGRSFFTNDGKLNITEVGRFPALLVTETGGNGTQYTKVAHITKIHQGSSTTTIHYIIDSSIPSISNKELEGYVTQIGISRNNLHHTHWRICDADLFKILLLNNQKSAIYPKYLMSMHLNAN
ncbi:hypothetical protein [Nitrosomonas communis]|uniref:Uncharacterized protein n=1 Tax=Nitrosomonas communis TaxID=44574 RepID=A0A1H2SD17_9PROT|nr:hypothetical protein [Nitrosomonas communis]SDW29541.1 hypothetical protein SAMN05421882_10072 [Nitrosomonas communis]